MNMNELMNRIKDKIHAHRLGFGMLIAAVVLGSIVGIKYHNRNSGHHGKLEFVVREDESTEDSLSTESLDSTESPIENSVESPVEIPEETAPQLAIISNPPDVESLTKVIPVFASSTSELAPESNTIYYHAQNAIDGNVITSWQEGVKGKGEGERLKIEFRKNSKIRYMKLHLGNWRDLQRYLNNNRSKTMKIETAYETYNFFFEDKMEPVWLDFGREIETEYISFILGEVYPGSFSDDTCISEIEFYR